MTTDRADEGSRAAGSPRRKPAATRRGAAAKRSPRVVISGGPAAGKTAVVELIRRHLVAEVTTVPEAATILFSGGFPRAEDSRGRRAVQRAIFAVQRATEELYSGRCEGRPLVCDRGSLDGAAYWPGGLAAFCREMGTTTAAEFARYDAVIFLESTAYDVRNWPEGQPHRTESPAEACLLDRKLRKVWSAHPRFHFIPHAKNFYEKVALCLITLHRVLGVGSADGVAVDAARAAVAAADADDRATAVSATRGRKARPRARR